MKIRRPYNYAKPIADRVQELLEPWCTAGRCIIAGSVRRRESFIGDIEIVCEPQTIDSPTTDLFGEPCDRFRTDEWSNAVVDMFKGRVTIGDPTYGRYTSGLLEINPSFGGGQMQVDIFMPQPDDYYRQLAIRTGSADFSRMIAHRWVQAGWRGTEDGLRRHDEVEERSGKFYMKKSVKPTLPPVWESEHHFFDWLGIEWVEPELR